MIRSFALLAWNGFREARRNRVTLVAVAVGVTVLLIGVLLTEASVAVFDRVLVDVALGAMTLSLVLLTVFLSSGQLSREIERRTIFLVMAQPISRSQFLLARLAGTMLTVFVLLAVMFACFAVELALFRVPFQLPYLWAAAGLWFELLVLASIGLAMSSFAGQITSSVVTLSLFLAGHLSGDIYALAMKSNEQAVRTAVRGVYYLLPNLERLNFRGYASYGAAVPVRDALQGIGYGIGYAAVVATLGVFIFQRRDFK